MAIGQEITYLRDFAEDAEKLRASWGRTDRFKTGETGLDAYLGGGFGRKDGYEIVMVFGPTKIGKSIFTLNLLKGAVLAGDRVGLITLEDDGPDVYLRFTRILGQEGVDKYVKQGDTVHIISPAATEKAWKLEELLEMIESWFVDRRCDVILLDHLQFAFENAEAVRGENEYIAQRVFMQRLNHMVKRLKKTIILVNHINKDSNAKGINKAVGSGSIPQGATKIIEITRGSEADTLEINLHGSRHTRTPEGSHLVKLRGMQIGAVSDKWF